MVLYYLLLAHCLLLWYSSTVWPTAYSTILYWLIAYHYGTLLHSSSPLPMPMLPYYLKLAHCVYPCYSTNIYWLPAYIFGTLLFSTGPLPIPIILFNRLLDHCLFLFTAYIYGTLLPSTGSLSFHMVLYYLLLANCLSLWHSTTFFWPTAYSTILHWSLPIPMILF